MKQLKNVLVAWMNCRIRNVVALSKNKMKRGSFKKLFSETLEGMFASTDCMESVVQRSNCRGGGRDIFRFYEAPQGSMQLFERIFAQSCTTNEKGMVKYIEYDKSQDPFCSLLFFKTVGGHRFRLFPYD